MKKIKTGCDDCGLDYGDAGFPDLVIPTWAWRQISSTKDDGGLLCPSCINRALVKKKIKCEGAFKSGNIRSVSPEMMQLIRQVENLELMKEDKDAYKGD